MGTILAFPALAASRQPGKTNDGSPRETISRKVVSRKETSRKVLSGKAGTVLILPVVRIERAPEETSGGRGPEEGTAAPGRRRRRR